MDVLRIHDTGRGREICSFDGLKYPWLDTLLRLRHQHRKATKARAASSGSNTAAAIQPFPRPWFADELAVVGSVDLVAVAEPLLVVVD